MKLRALAAILNRSSEVLPHRATELASTTITVPTFNRISVQLTIGESKESENDINKTFCVEIWHVQDDLCFMSI